MARLLRLAVPLPARHRHPLEFVPTSKTRSDLLELTVKEESPVAGRRIMDLALPRSSLIVLVGRGEDFVAPRGGTVLEKGDSILVLGDRDDGPRLKSLIEGGAGE